VKLHFLTRGVLFLPRIPALVSTAEEINI